MDGFDGLLRKILDGFAKFLREKELVLPSHQPYRVRWVKGFLRFTRERVGFTLGQTARPVPGPAFTAGRRGSSRWSAR